MDFDISPEAREFSKEVFAFLKREVTPELEAEVNSGDGPGPVARQFIKKLGEKGWLTPMLPEKYGGLGLSFEYRYVFADELFYFLPDLWTFTGAQIVAPVLMMVGTEEQRSQYLLPISRGEIEFALGYTEPEAGSDLSNIAIRAVEKDDHFVINGQKMYSTACHYSQYHWLCARTAVVEPKHTGLSLFIVPLDTQGITYSGMRTMAGERTNQVYYDEVKVPKNSLVGQKNKGFLHLAAALEYERIFPVGKLRRTLDDMVSYVQKKTFDGRPLANDPLVRSKLAEMAIQVEVAQGLAYRLIWLVEAKQPLGHETAIEKLFVTELEQRIAQTAIDVMGQGGVLDGVSAEPGIGWVSHWFLSNARRTISAGSSEIQRNIISQRGLALPRN